MLLQGERLASGGWERERIGLRRTVTTPVEHLAQARESYTGVVACEPYGGRQQ